MRKPRTTAPTVGYRFDPPAPDRRGSRVGPPRTMKLSPIQVAASALAAVCAAVIASYFGVRGTVIGTALGSIVATVATALFAHSIERTNKAVRRVVPVPGAGNWLTTVRAPGQRRREGRGTRGSGTSRPQRPPAAPGVRWRLVTAGALASFALALGIVTVIELVAGRSLSSLLDGQPSGGAQTTVGQLVHQAEGHPNSPVPTTTSPTPTSTTTTTLPGSTSTTTSTTTTTTAPGATSTTTTSTSTTTTTVVAGGGTTTVPGTKSGG